MINKVCNYSTYKLSFEIAICSVYKHIPFMSSFGVACKKKSLSSCSWEKHNFSNVYGIPQVYEVAEGEKNEL